ncbi:MAG: RNA polymerase factor sigma-54 [Thermodesulfobacteriaceae bacterium]|nr:RNA polymerase factor sigma-54 [Thermodesulfobacteriaceae bacterium]MDW8136240.1 RNA polymerase factor sigma-54 [Thermodesulfobacterium sp.]
MVEIKNQLKLLPQLLLTPQLKLLLKVLQLNTLELNEFLLEEVQSNPFLEIEYKDLPKLETKEETLEEIGLSEELTWNTEDLYDKEAFITGINEEEANLWEKYLKAEESLSEYLSWQMGFKELTPLEREIANYLIGNLDQRGYLTILPSEVAKEFKVDLSKVEKVRKILKFLDPLGVASLDLKECLITQLEFLGYSKDSLPYILVEKHLEELEHGIEALSQKYGYEKGALGSALEVIKNLEPYPARNFTFEKTIYVEPDLIFYKEEEEWKVQINKEGIYKIKFSSFYKKFNSYKNLDFKSKNFLKEKIRNAEMLLKALDGRFTSLYKVGFSILQHQVDFLEKGVKYMKPLTLKMIAQVTGLHESTVSRIIAHKYVQTPLGIYPLKFFFSTGYTNLHGKDLSSKAVKDYIKEIISNEKAQKPYSDSEIAKILKQKYGINIARRTVSKYREELKIPSIRERKNKNFKRGGIN